jgi:hypothetical protein
MFSQKTTAVTRKTPRPPVPVVYVDAVKALQACTTFDEARMWHNRGEALAAWARIYRQNEALTEAKRLKLHAFRRMGVIAAELRPGGESSRGRLPGPTSLMMEHGFKKHEATAACQLADMADSKFAKILVRPLAPTTVADVMTKRNADWRNFAKCAHMLRAACRNQTPTQVAAAARQLRPRHREGAKEAVRELIEWLEQLEQRLT